MFVFRILTFTHDFKKGPLSGGCRKSLISFLFRMNAKLYMFICGTSSSKEEIRILTELKSIIEIINSLDNEGEKEDTITEIIEAYEAELPELDELSEEEEIEEELEDVIEARPI